jgi:uncharacterized membrane protein
MRWKLCALQKAEKDDQRTKFRWSNDHLQLLLLLLLLLMVVKPPEQNHW